MSRILVNPHSPYGAKNGVINCSDQTPKGGEVRIKLHLTEEESAEYLSGNWHVRIVK
jgi:hypothetical protein